MLEPNYDFNIKIQRAILLTPVVVYIISAVNSTVLNISVIPYQFQKNKNCAEW